MNTIQLIFLAIVFSISSQSIAEEIKKAELTPLDLAKEKCLKLQAENTKLHRVLQEHIRGTDDRERENNFLKERNTIYRYSLVSVLIIFAGIFYIMTCRIRYLKSQLKQFFRA